MRSVFGSEGTVREVDLLPAFVALWRAQETGRLGFSRGSIEVLFDLREGDVVALSTTDPRFDAAAVLVRAGKLDAGALDRLSTPGGIPLALAALQAGILTKREWRWGEKIRSIEVLTDLVGWPDGRYRFDRDFSPEPSEFHLPVPRLLLELFLRSRDEELVRDALGDENASLHRSSTFEEEFSSFGLTADAESVVRLIDGRASTAEIARNAPADEFAVRKLVAALAVLGLVRTEAHTGPRGIVAVPELSREEEELASAELDERVETVVLRGALEPPPLEPEEPTEVEEDRFRADTFDAPPPVWQETTAPDAQRNSPGDAWDLEPPERGAGGVPIDNGPGSETPEPPEPPARRGGVALLALILLLAAVVGAVLWLRSRPISQTTTAAAPPTPAWVPAEEPTAIEVPSSAAATPLQVPATAPPAARSTPLPAARPTAPPTRAAVAAPASGDPERRTWNERAQRDRRRLASEASTRFAIQLMLACEIPSLTDAWRHDRPAGTIWLLATDHKGRSCYRVLWGRYPSLEAARRAQEGVPGHFRQGTNRPAVIDVRKTLLP